MQPLFTIDCYEAGTKELPIILVTKDLAIGLVTRPVHTITHVVTGHQTAEAFLFEAGGKMRYEASNGSHWTLPDHLPAAALLAECESTGELDAGQLATFRAAITHLEATPC